jgi:spore coat polysaccharide biosynthesis protein SpsF
MILDKKIGIIIQARMGSSRLPSKVMLNIKEKPILQYEIDRLGSLKYPIYIATTVQPQDDAIVKFATDRNILYYRGSEDNVLQRYYECALLGDLDIIIRITSDCPLIDANIIDYGITQYVNANDDDLYLSNTLDRSYPRGADFEIFSFKQLKNAYESATDLSDIEHVTPYIWKNKSGDINISQIKQDQNFSMFRLTLDTPEDFELIQKLIDIYAADKLDMEGICNIMTQNPDLPMINDHIQQKKN